MNKHPMLSVKEAANLMGCDERWVRERLNQGQLKGEKKNIGLKEKWFVYAGEVEAAIAKRSLTTTDYQSVRGPAPSAEPSKQAMDSETVVIDGDWNDNENEAIDDETRLAWLRSQREALVEVAEEMMRPIISRLEETNHLLQKKEEALQAATYQLGYAKGRMEEQEEKIKLLPDYQARAEKAVQIERDAAEAKERAKALEEALSKAEAERYAAEKLSSEILLKKAEEAKLLEEENQQLKQKVAEAALAASKVADLEKRVEELQKPKGFWQKVFGGQ